MTRIEKDAVAEMVPLDQRDAPVGDLESRVASAIEEMKAWSATAFRSADLQPLDDELGRRFIEHGAMCYANCALRLQTALDGASPPPSEAPSGSQ